MKVEGFKELIGNLFSWTGIYVEINFEDKTFRTTYGEDQLIDVELPKDAP